MNIYLSIFFKKMSTESVLTNYCEPESRMQSIQCMYKCCSLQTWVINTPLVSTHVTVQGETNQIHLKYFTQSEGAD